jgi:hypothetical protein
MESVFEICLNIILIAATIGFCIVLYELINDKR